MIFRERLSICVLSENNKKATNILLSATYVKKAFSLAEVMITLVIIGIIGVMVVPLIEQVTGRHETVVRVKKASSVLGQAIYKIAVQEGLPVGDYGYITEDGDSEFFERFSNVVEHIRICRGTPSGCLAVSEIKQLNGRPMSGFTTKNSLVARDGIAYGWDKNACPGKGLSADDEENCIGCFIVDVNGDKKPNRYGYDLFFFLVVDRKGIVPAGKGNHSADCRRSGIGAQCTSKVIDEEGINYLY